MNKYRLIFEKNGRAKYISHLDLMRTFQRVFKRAGIEVKHTEGFNPHAHISIALPLPVGMESVCEIMDFETLIALENGVIEELNKSMPEGIKAIKIYENTRKTGEIAWVGCELTLIYDRGIPAAAVSDINELFNSESIIVSKKSKKGRVDFDIIPCIKSLKINENGSNEILIDAIVAAQNPSLNPMLITDAIAKYLPETAPDFSCCVRKTLMDKDLMPFL